MEVWKDEQVTEEAVSLPIPAPAEDVYPSYDSALSPTIPVPAPPDPADDLVD